MDRSPSVSSFPKRFSLFDYLRADLARSMRGNAHRSGLRGLVVELMQPGTQAIVVYRLGNWLENNLRIPILRQLALGLYSIPHFYARAVLGVNVPRTAQIGPGFVIHTWQGINVGQIRAGRNLTLLHGITLDYDCEEIGDDVLVGAGAKVIRGVKIGSRVHIGANAVVMQDIPDDSIAVGIPARIIPAELTGSGAIHYIDPSAA